MFVMAGFAVLTFIILFLHPQTGDEGQTLYVRFVNIDKVNVGTRVNFAGKPVGEVVDIREIAAPRETEMGEEDAFIYPYELELKIDSHLKVFDSDEISIRTAGLLGERSVSITPKHARRNTQARQVNSKDPLFAVETPTVEEALEKVSELADSAMQVIDHVLQQLDHIKDQNIWENAGKTAKNLSEITGSLNRPTDYKEILDNLKAFSERLQSACTNIFSFTNKLNEGDSTISRLVNQDDLYLRLTALLTKGSTVMDDITHYGLLFHNDKGWQRLRARRMNLMQKLQCPQAFRNFFNDEVNLISTSLARVASVLDQTFAFCPPQQLLDDKSFECLFADLLQRISGLEENIKMYNEQLVSEHEKSRCCTP